MMRKQGELVREQRQRMKEHTSFMEGQCDQILKMKEDQHRSETKGLKTKMSDMEKTHQKVLARRDRKVAKLEKDSAQVRQLKEVLMELQCKLYAKTEECDDLERELQREKRASRQAISNAMEGAEEMMSNAITLMNEAKDKKEELKTYTESTVKEYLKEERRRSSRKKAIGESQHCYYSIDAYQLMSIIPMCRRG